LKGLFSFSSSKLVDRPFDWAYQLEDLGYTGWEIVNEGRQRITPENLADARKIAEATELTITVHMPYSDLNLASLNQPIWEETVHQMKSTLSLSSEFARLAVVHPGHLSPLGMQMPGHEDRRREHGEYACTSWEKARGDRGHHRDC